MAIEPGIPVPGVVQTDTNRVEIFVIAQICRQAVTFVLPVILADQGCIQRPKVIAKILIQRQLSPVTPAIGDIRRNVIIATVGTQRFFQRAKSGGGIAIAGDGKICSRLQEILL